MRVTPASSQSSRTGTAQYDLPRQGTERRRDQVIWYEEVGRQVSEDYNNLGEGKTGEMGQENRSWPRQTHIRTPGKLRLLVYTEEGLMCQVGRVHEVTLT